METWFNTWDKRKRHWVRMTKEAHDLPIVQKSAQGGGVVTRAHAWAWAKERPTPRAKTLTTWLPYASPRHAVGDYWHHLILGYFMHAPEML